MTIKLQLPSPSEMSFEGFIKQMQTIIKALEKSYDNVKSEVPEEKWEEISYYFTSDLLEIISSNESKARDERLVLYDDAYDESQRVYVVISY